MDEHNAKHTKVVDLRDIAIKATGGGFNTPYNSMASACSCTCDQKIQSTQPKGVTKNTNAKDNNQTTAGDKSEAGTSVSSQG